MKRLLFVTCAAAAIGLGATAAHAANVDEVWNFGTPAEGSTGLTGDLGTQTETVTALPTNVGIPTIGVSEFGVPNHVSGNGTDKNLYIKTVGGDETGLGINNDPTGDHEISAGNGTVQLNISSLTVPPLVSFSLSFGMDSATSPDKWGVCLTDTANSTSNCGVSFTGTADETLQYFSIQDGSTGHPYTYLDVYAVTGNVLLTEIDAMVNVASVPEPASLGLLGLGVLGTVAFASRRRAT